MRQLFLFPLILLLFCCQDSPKSPHDAGSYIKLGGETMGTFYEITCKQKTRENLQPIIESLLAEINAGVNTYDDQSLISRLNRSGGAFNLSEEAASNHFLPNFIAAKTIFEKTEGNFDPTIMPIVNYWGFGYIGKKPVTQVDSFKVDSLLQYVGFEKINLIEGERISIEKQTPGIQLDFSAIAKGYAVDAVGKLLESRGINHYLVNIGGEIRAKGKNAKGNTWTIGINTPSSEAALSDFMEAVPLENQSLASSGNYRNFYEVDGVKYGHTMNPKTGYPELNRLLGTSVMAKECMMADGYATAFMAMGLDKAFSIAKQTEGIEAYFVYSKTNGEMAVEYTSGFEDLVK